MPIRYEWKDTPLTIKNASRANPQRIGEELTRITNNNNGRLTPRAAREAARSPRSPLHRHLEWDDHKAAEERRLDQVREIIRLIRVVEITSDRQQVARPAFVSINEGRKGTSYRPLSAVIDNLDLQVRVMKQAERDLAAWESRYNEFIDICDLVRAARETLAGRRTAVETGLPVTH